MKNNETVKISENLISKSINSRDKLYHNYLYSWLMNNHRDLLIKV